ncbi:hypothetical protein [Erysipelothrix aquatica]|uniref:hypothetical protein n=1 Tax=Erysipelothrix aquatica TaxID=2683714 RepID=UPI00135ABB14|nr:hypothetical protein [Erysipelothrix aquatica]
MMKKRIILLSGTIIANLVLLYYFLMKLNFMQFSIAMLSFEGNTNNIDLLDLSQTYINHWFWIAFILQLLLFILTLHTILISTKKKEV